MQNGPRLDAIDTRTICRVYGIVAGLAGLLLFAWGPNWFGTDLAAQPWGKAALIRVIGSILVACACFAVPLASIADPEIRQRALLWFAAGYGVIFIVLLSQREAIWGPGLADWAVATAFAVALFLTYFGATAFGDATAEPPWSRLITLFGEPVPRVAFFGGVPLPSRRKLHSQYEQQIREAAGQEERNRLARDLHDSVKQQIFAIQTFAATAQARFDNDSVGAKETIDQIRRSAREAMIEMEVMLDQLRAAPLENTGLVEALKAQCEALGFRTGARVQCNVDKLPPSDLMAPGSQQAIFRVAQEAMANIARHARAGNVVVALCGLNGELQLRVQDDGAGFVQEQDRRTTGLAGMRERAEECNGRVEVSSQPGAGTSVIFSVPYAEFEPVRYSRKVMVWASVLLICGASACLTRDRVLMVWALFCVIALIREVVASRRARKLREALS